MNKIILGFLLGVLTTLLIFHQIPWEKLFTTKVLQLGFATFLALLAGLIALYQVKANVISSARIKWIEEFKTNISEYIASFNEAVFAAQIHLRSPDKDEMEYYNKYFNAINKNHILENKIRLNLNLKEKIYQDIDKDLNDIKDILDTQGISNIKDEVEEQVLLKFNSLAENTSKALKFEWDKSKKMFYSRWWNEMNKSE